MIESDLGQFTEILDSLSEYYQAKEPLSQMAIKIYFRALQPYEMSTISDALNKHLQDTNGGRFYPKAADLIRHIEGGEITLDMIVASAKVADSPLGCLSRIQIGSWDLNNQDAFYLRQRASECLLLLPKWKERAEYGAYSDHEISVMLKFDVSPAAPFAYGIAPPKNAAELTARVESVKASDRHIKFIEPPYVPESEEEKNIGAHPEVQKKLLAIMGSTDDFDE